MSNFINPQDSYDSLSWTVRENHDPVKLDWEDQFFGAEMPIVRKNYMEIQARYHAKLMEADRLDQLNKAALGKFQ